MNIYFPTTGVRQRELPMMESDRARLAALGLPGQALNAVQATGQTDIQAPVLPAAFAHPAISMGLSNYRGGPAAFSGGGAGYRPLVPQGAGGVPGLTLARTPPASRTSSSFSPRPGGTANLYNRFGAVAPGLAPRLRPGGDRNLYNLNLTRKKK